MRPAGREYTVPAPGFRVAESPGTPQILGAFGTDAAGTNVRILYLHQYFATPECATGTRSYEFGRLLVERGHQVTVVSGTSALEPWLGPTVHDGPRTMSHDGLELVLVPDKYEQTRSKIKRLRGFSRFVRGAVKHGWSLPEPDVVFCTSPPLPIALSGIALAKKHGVPLVLEIRDLWPESLIEFGDISPTHPGILAAQGLEWVAYKGADRIVATTPGCKRTLVARGLDPDTIDVVELGADPGLFQPGSGDGSYRKAWGAEGRFVALFPGAHGIANGLDILVDAAKILQDRDSKVLIVLVGRGQLKPDLMAQAERHGLTNIRFLDPVPKTELVQMIDEIDVGLAILKPCGLLDRILSNKLFDFLAAGKPVMANLPGDMKAVLEEGDCGFFVPDMTPQGLADALDSASKVHHSTRRAMGRRARKLAEGRYSRSSLVDTFEQALLKTRY